MKIEYMVVTFKDFDDIKLQKELDRLNELRWELVSTTRYNQLIFKREKK